jgi:KipI family sensor histidine kinase inhibitor
VPLYEVRAAGDAALIVRLPEKIDPQVNGWCIALARALRLNLPSVIRDIVLGYSSVTVYFDPLRIDAAWLEGEIETTIRDLENEFGTSVDVALTRAVVDVPVRYGGDHGPDLADVARFAGCSDADVIARHTRREYRVYLVGFVPGFAYMAEVEASIAAPRRATPRTAVPAGSVAIAGGQTGIYPAVTPGGWNIIGRTPLVPYDPQRRQPFLFKPGDRVRFRSV